jgi:steroid 5-alpha-reductase/3-oxo-5-alpha-steroid 4-dehydrogenase 1
VTPFLWACAAWTLASALVFAVLQLTTAPYGRHARRGFGPAIPARAAWIAMELPAVVVPAWVLATAPGQVAPTSWLAFALWWIHYEDRALIWPWRMRLGGRTMPLGVAALAFSTNVAVDGLVAWGLAREGAAPALSDPALWAGLALFALGYAVNRDADARLRALRPRGGSGYAIPRGGLYEWVSCPNYLGELVMWAGFALVAGGPEGWVFLGWSAANLVPRARHHHRWYRETFPEYPAGRRALIPALW